MNVVLVTDLDNTLYNFVDYFGKSFRAMVHALARKTGLSEREIKEDFRKVYAKHGSIEYSFSVQELDLCKNRKSTEVSELVKAGRGAFRVTRKKHFKPYPGVKETLKWAEKEGVELIAFSNAPYIHASTRLKVLKCDNYYNGIAAWDKADPIPERFPETREIKSRQVKGRYESDFIERKWKLQENELKPNKDGYKRIFNDLEISKNNIYVVGDSVKKDIAPAMELGAKGIWARYGKEFKEKNLKTLIEITDWGDKEIEKTYDNPKSQPDYVIDNFSEIQSILPFTQSPLFTIYRDGG